MNNKNRSNATIGPIIGSLIVVIILVVAALYVWDQHLSIEAKRQIDIQNATALEGKITIVKIESTSTKPSDIQNDLNSSQTVIDPATLK